MSIRYDPLLARALAKEIAARWGDARVASLGLDPARRAALLAFEDGSRLVALLHREHGHIVAEPAPAGSAPDADAGWDERRFGRLFVGSVEAPPDERALVIILRDAAGQAREGLALELQTNRGNALHLARQGDDEPPEWRIERALVSGRAGARMLRPGATYAPPASTRRAIVSRPEADDWAASLPEGDAAARRRAVLETWAWTSALNIAWLLGEDDGAAGSFERYLRLRASVEAPTEAWVGRRRWGRQPYPLRLAASDRPASGGLLGALGALVEEAGGVARALEEIGRASPAAAADDEAGRLGARLRAARKRARKRVAALERQLAGAGPPEGPRAQGQLLLARKHEVPRGAEKVTLEDFDGAPVEIALDPAVDVVTNAERLFAEARRRERARERLPARIAEAEARVARFEEGLAALAEAGPTDSLWRLAGGDRARAGAGRARSGAGGAGTAAARARAAETRLPYTRLVSSGGLEIRVGRGARDNDALTFRHSAPDDIWLHASQTSGAHVILRWGKKDENPPGRDLAEAAVVAAVHSGARHSATVPVVWTRRKHVRKPRKSPPGTVIPDRAKTLFVRPDEALVRALTPPP